MDSHKLQPVEAQYFSGPVADEEKNGSRTIPALLRDVAQWMDENDIADTEFQNIVVEIHWQGDRWNYSATVYHLGK